MYKKILVPIEASNLSTTTVSKAIVFAKQIDAHITFVYARPDFGATGDGALIHTISPENYEKSAVGKARGLLAGCEVEAELAGILFQSIVKTSDKPYQVIIDTAEEEECDLIFMASHGQGGLKGLFLGSQTQKVLSHTKIPVLVSSIESNSPSPEMNTAISIIKGEHRSIAAVIKGLQHAIKNALVTQELISGQLLRGMLLYLRKFTNELHHPKEEEYLFPHLRGKSMEIDSVIDKLKLQHVEEPELLQSVEIASRAYQASSGEENLKSLEKVVDRFAERLWEHMSLEEKCILPQCSHFFSHSDWSEVAEAFQKNGDPRFDKDTSESYENLYTRLMNLAQDE